VFAEFSEAHYLVRAKIQQSIVCVQEVTPLYKAGYTRTLLPSHIEVNAQFFILFLRI
jgi:hypothetical protein